MTFKETYFFIFAFLPFFQFFSIINNYIVNIAGKNQPKSSFFCKSFRTIHQYFHIFAPFPNLFLYSSQQSHNLSENIQFCDILSYISHVLSIKLTTCDNLRISCRQQRVTQILDHGTTISLIYISWNQFTQSVSLFSPSLSPSKLLNLSFHKISDSALHSCI